MTRRPPVSKRTDTLFPDTTLVRTAPVPVGRVARREDRLGGAANVARNIVALGAQASLLGLVGGDEAGGRVRDLAREAGINSCLVVDNDSPTTLKMRDRKSVV